MQHDDSIWTDIDEKGKMDMEHSHDISIQGYVDKAKEELEKDQDFFDEMREKILKNEDEYISRILSSKYAKIEIFRNKKEYIEIRGTIELDPDITKLVDLKKEYPNADINMVNHHGALSKIIVTEKNRIYK